MDLSTMDPVVLATGSAIVGLAGWACRSLAKWLKVEIDCTVRVRTAKAGDDQAEIRK